MFMNIESAIIEFGMMCTPDGVFRWVARQLTSTIRPRTPLMTTQSPSSNGCSNNSSRPVTIEPSGAWRARPMTMDPTPSAAKSPPMSAPQTKANSTARHTTMSRMRTMSMKIDGTRLRQLPCRAVTKSAKFRVLKSTRISRKPKAVAVT